jgi:predicted nucleic-acid-binding protein
MIGLDTNVLVRYLTQDHPAQALKASQLIEKHCTQDAPGFVSLVVLCELVWVLRGAYGYQKTLVVEVLEHILAVRELQVEAEHIAGAALRAFRRGRADFADYIVVFSNQAKGCGFTYSFDQKLISHPSVRTP